MEQLLSLTTTIGQDHTKLAELIAASPIVDCRQLGLITHGAIVSYFRELNPENSNKASRLVKAEVHRRVRSFANTVIYASTEFYDYLDIPDDDADPPKIENYFLPYEVPAADHSLSEDGSIRHIFDRIPEAIKFTEGNVMSYMFRVGTSDPHTNLIPMIHRIDPLGPLNGRTISPTVTYDLSFAGYGCEIG